MGGGGRTTAEATAAAARGWRVWLGTSSPAEGDKIVEQVIKSLKT